MAISLSSPVTGAAVTGLTTPTHSYVTDYPPNAWSKQFACNAIGGTQAGVDTGTSASKPWTLMAYRPQNIRVQSSVDANNVLRMVPMNEYGLVQRRGLYPLAGQPPKTAVFRASFAVPAGAELADTANLKSAVSSFIGALWQQSNGIYETLATGVL